MDARGEIRALLEQRRELGETDVVLDGATAAEAMAIARGGTPRGGKAPFARAHKAAQVEATGDWRDTLRSAGVAPGAPAASRPIAKTPPPSPKAAAPSPDVAVTPASPVTRAPDGLVIGTPVTEVFTGWTSSLSSLSDIAASVATCTRCPLYATAKNPVPGEGNPDANLMIVGEAPGQTEDETGSPFIGKAGQLLTKMLVAIQLSREEVFVCNVLKHRPPGNRNPAPDEVRACSPYLVRQIELVRPKIIIALGTFAAQTLLDSKTPVGKLRGQVHRYHGVPLVVTYHPAALLRNPAWKRPAWEDMQLAQSILTANG